MLNFNFYFIKYKFMKEIGIDPIDLQLLNQLQKDASLSNQALAQKLHVSVPTCMRRVARLRSLGLIERQVALLQPEKIAQLLGRGLQAIVEVSLDHQSSELMDAFEKRAVADNQVAMCWRVSSGPDFVLMIQVSDMPDYLLLVKRMFSSDANVRNLKVFFSTKQCKLVPSIPLPSSI